MINHPIILEYYISICYIVCAYIEYSKTIMCQKLRYPQYSTFYTHM